MTREELTAFVTGLVPDMIEGTNKQYPEVIVTASQIHDLAKSLKAQSESNMDYLFSETAADRKDGLHMYYHLSSTLHGHTLMIRVILADKENAVIPSLSDIWSAAEFYEREIFDLFGVHFENHPDLRRIFLEDDWVGHPLRKDYKDTYTLER